MPCASMSVYKAASNLVNPVDYISLYIVLKDSSIMHSMQM